MFARSIVASVLSALVVGSALPAAAAYVGGSAGGEDTTELAQVKAEKTEKKEKKDKKDKGDHAKNFPMKADVFKKHVDARLAKARGKLAAALEKRKVSEEERNAALKRFDDGAVKVRAAADRAGKDGTVTLEEAKDVRAVAKAERKAMKGAVANRDKKGKKSKKA
ncbi:MAG: hypothetical protein HOV80_22995 [Polyangiaceae bacterium]|nr:hypothetical protein [Polyangiaceae bacterium]